MINYLDSIKERSIQLSTQAVNHPCYNYVKYLIINNKTDEEIEHIIVSFGFPPLPLDYVEIVKSSLLDEPIDFDPQNKFHKESMEYLKKLEIYNLFHPDKFTKEALNYISNVELRPFIERLLLSKLPAKEIAKQINSRFNKLATANGIDSYRHYFWNVNLVRIEDWVNLLSNPGDRDTFISIIRNGPPVALYTLGFPQKVEAKSLLEEAMEITGFDMKQWKFRPASVDKAKALSLLVKNIISIDTQLSSEAKILKDTLNDFKVWKMEHIEPKTASIHDVAELDNYTESGAKLDDIEIPKLKAYLHDNE
jgi:hypothetical protein